MNTILPPQHGDPGNGRISGEEMQESINPEHHEVNIADGAEFLDDGIRMKDQPLIYTEENNATGNPEN